MSFVATKSKFHIALNGNGLMLQGALDRLAYEMKQAPFYNTRFGQGDRSYSDFYFWWYWTQTDWLGGIKEEGNWADDASFLTSNNVDAYSRGGQISLNLKPGGTSPANGTITSDSTSVSVGLYGKLKLESTALFYAAYNGTVTSWIISSAVGTGAWDLETGETATNVNDMFIAGEILYLLTNKAGGGIDTWDGTTNTDRDTAYKAGGAPTYDDYTCGFEHNGVAYVWATGNTDTVLKSSSNEGATWQDAGLIIKNINTRVYDSISYNGAVYYMLTKGATVSVANTELRKFDGTTDVLVAKFPGMKTHSTGGRHNRSMAVSPAGNLYVSFSNGQIWKIDSDDTLTQVYKDLGAYIAVDSMMVVHKSAIHLGNIVIDDSSGTTRIYNGRRNTADDAAGVPLASNGSVMVFVTSPILGTNFLSLYTEIAGTFYASGTITLNEFAEISAIDKLWNQCILNFTTLVSGQTITVEYSTDNGTTYTTLGSASFTVDGAVKNKILPFGDAIVSKKLLLRFTLAGGGSNTPTLQDYTVRYIPVPNYTKLWNLNINCGDEVKRLDGGSVETVGRQLKGILETAWWTKSVLDFQDLDYATTLLSGALAASGDITVDSTYDFPEQGRLRVDNEEVLYTSKTPTTFVDCTRGARETKAVTHLDNAVINNAYKVILTDIQYRIPIALEDRELEYAVGLSLREV